MDHDLALPIQRVLDETYTRVIVALFLRVRTLPFFFDTRSPSFGVHAKERVQHIRTVSRNGAKLQRTAGHD